MKLISLKFWVVAVLMLAALPVWATTIVAPDPFELRQPDGTTFTAVRRGDIHSFWTETKAGHSIVQQGGVWYYADLKDNQLVASADAVGATSDAVLAARPLHLAPRVDPSVYEIYTPTPTRPAVVFNQNVLVVLLAFADTPMNYPQSGWVSQFFGATSSVREHYLQMSGANFVVTPATETHGTANDGVIAVTLGYNHPNMGTGGMGTTVQDALTVADPFINYAAYDADSDGQISAKELSVIFILSGYESAYGGGGTPGSWAHASGVTPFTLDAVQLSPYARFGERQGDHQATIGIMSHELGHLMLGLPDLYDRTPSGSADSQGVGKWCLMAAGSWNATGGQNSGETPAHMLAWTKIKSGFTTPTEVVSPVTGVTITPADTSLSLKRIWIDKYRVREHFLLESRRLTSYDAGLPGPGLLITHIDPSVGTQNDDETHKLVDIEEADGLNGLDNNTNQGDTGDPYPGSSSNTTFNDLSNPNSKDYASASTGVSVTNVSDTGGGTMSVDINPGSAGGGDNVRYDQQKSVSSGSAYGSEFYTGLEVTNTSSYDTLDGFEVYLVNQGFYFTVEAKIYQGISGGVPQTLLHSQTFTSINALTNPWSRLLLTTPQPFPPTETRFVVFRIVCCSPTYVYYSPTSPVSGRSYQSSNGAAFVPRAGGDWPQIMLFGGTGSGCSAPSAPTLGTATGTCSGVNSAWTAGTGTTSSYNVYRAGACGGSYSKIAGPLVGLTYSDTSGVPGTSYGYVVRGACDAGGLTESPNSNCLTATGEAIPVSPAAPTFSGVACTAATVNWAAVPAAATYDVFRSPGAACATPAMITGSPIASTTYPDSGLTPDTPYSYFITANSACGTSANGACASITPTGTPGTPTIVFTETFDGPTAPALPADWATLQVTGATAVWTTNAGTVNPAGGGTHSGANLARFNSYDATATHQARLYRTSGVNLSTSTAASVSFWMYHDNQYTNLDTVQASTSTDLGGSWVLQGAAINRYVAAAPAWTQHTVNLAGVTGSADVRIAFLGTSAFGNDTHIDDVTISSTPAGSSCDLLFKDGFQ